MRRKKGSFLPSLPAMQSDGYTNYDMSNFAEGKARCKAALQKVRRRACACCACCASALPLLCSARAASAVCFACWACAGPVLGPCWAR